MGRRGADVPLESPERSLQYAEEHVFERVSVARDHEILTEALRHGRGHIGAAELKGTLALQEGRGEILRNGGEIATTASLEREREMIAAVNRGIGAFEPLGGNMSFEVSERLNPEQQHVVESVLASRDGAVNISGAAGTGKTATLQELRRGLIAGGRSVLAVAPTMSAVEELQKVGFQDAVTVERLLRDERMQANLDGRVLIVDEAGMVSARQMWELLKLAERRRIVRIVFSGDTRQIQSVEAGDALRILEEESRMKSPALTQVRRQTVADYRKAMEELRRDPERGFERLERIGAVREVPSVDRAEAVARAWAVAGGQNVLVVCATHAEIDRVTEAIRAERNGAGALGKAANFQRDVSLNWTTVQKQEVNNYRPGMLLGFHREVKGIAKNETVEVVRVDARAVVVRNERGEQRSITGKQAKSFDVLERQNIEVAVGDRLSADRQPQGRGVSGDQR